MKKLIVLFLAAVLCSCGEEAPQVNTNPTPCECYEASKKQGGAQNEICDEKARDESFAHEITKCKAAELLDVDVSDVDIPKPPSTHAPADGTYSWSTEQSSLIWVGSKLVGDSHMGTVNVKGGSVEVTNGNISGGTIIIDMASIVCTDLEGEDATDIVSHLKGTDFFDVENHSEATFTLDKVEVSNQVASIDGTLSIKGIENAETLQSLYSASGDNEITLSGAVVFDRTKYEIVYKSGSVFDGLGDAAIDDVIRIKFDLIGTLDSALE